MSVDIQLVREDGSLEHAQVLADAENIRPALTDKDIQLKGEVLVQIFDVDGNVTEEVVGNLITTAGDEYYAKRSAAGVSPAAPADVTKVDGMKLGTGTTAAAKSGAGAALVTYITGSNNPFDATFPSFIDLSGDTGWQIQYKTTWAAGDVTNSAITEAVITKDSTTDATSTAANTTSRVVFTAINKTASDTLVITWNHTFNAA